MSRDMKTALVVLILGAALVGTYFWFMTPYHQCVSEREQLGSDEQEASAYCLKVVTGN